MSTSAPIQESSSIIPMTKRHSRLRSFLINFALIVFGLVLAGLLLELLLHFYNPFQARIKGNRIVLLTNKTVHFKNNIIKSLPPEVTVTRNSLGFRGPEPPADFGKVLTLVTIGGSTTQCFFLSDDQTWTARLGKQLEGSFHPLWINNAGLDGHSTHGHLALLEDFIVKLRPKIALFLVGVNDIANSQIGEFDAENVKSGLHFESAKAFFKSLSAYSEIAALVLNGYRSFNAYQTGLIHQQIDLKSQGHLDVPEPEQKQYVERLSGKSLQDYEGRLRRIVKICRNTGIEPVFITQLFWSDSARMR